jgi:hypothetical protein
MAQMNRDHRPFFHQCPLLDPQVSGVWYGRLVRLIWWRAACAGRPACEGQLEAKTTWALARCEAVDDAEGGVEWMMRKVRFGWQERWLTDIPTTLSWVATLRGSRLFCIYIYIYIYIESRYLTPWVQNSYSAPGPNSDQAAPGKYQPGRPLLINHHLTCGVTCVPATVRDVINCACNVKYSEPSELEQRRNTRLMECDVRELCHRLAQTIENAT